MFENGIVLSSPGRVFFQISGFEIYNYGVIIALAIFAGVIVSNYLANRSGKFPKDMFINLAPCLVICGIIGARCWYCLVYFKEYILLPLSAFNLRMGGISIHGAILAGFLVLLLYAKRKHISLVSLCDYAAPGLALGQTIGRWGNFFNNEAFGLPYNGFLKLYIPENMRPSQFIQYDYFHPAFLYESIGDLILFIVLFLILKSNKNRPAGLITLIYLVGYSILRFFVELIRVDSNVFIFNLPFPAFVSLTIFTVSIIILIFVLIKRYK